MLIANNQPSATIDAPCRILKEVFQAPDEDALTFISEEVRFGVQSFDGTVSMEIEGNVTKSSNRFFAHGACSNVYEGTWQRPGEEEIVVAIKELLRVDMEEARDPDTEKEAILRVNKRLNREVKVWRDASHRFVTPLLGFIAGKVPWLITPYYRNGDAHKWFRDHPEESRLRILAEIAEALVHLHSIGIIHADLKPGNILITDDGHAAICDFGLSKLLADLGIEDATATRGHGTQGFLAPETYYSDDQGMDFPRDVYAFGGLIVDLFSGTPPFWSLRRGIQVEEAVGRQHRTSPREEHPGVPDDAWNLAMKCWTTKVEKRPEMSQVLKELTAMLAQEQLPTE